MVRLSKIYTKTGDRGETSLGNAERVSKDCHRIEAIGTIDEVNAAIGVARLYCDDEVDDILAHIQNDLFDLGADLCVPEDSQKKRPPLRITAQQITVLESDIDKYNESLEPLNSFVLPGGCKSAAYLHMARTITRRAERIVVTLSSKENINSHIISYLNRLSDLLFVLSRHENDKGVQDILWIPGINR
jgi:cob(I)alamin adenosyltransferase